MFSLPRRYDAVIFDLLSGLLDSWTLWDAVAGSVEDGRRWRWAYLDITYRTGTYRPYEELVAEAALAAGLPTMLAGQLAARYAELRPWSEVCEVLQELRRREIRLAVVTNCSNHLGVVAVAQIGVPLDVVVTAEQAGFYKPDPRPYQLALERLDLPPERCLFVAGSSYDLVGTARVGLPTYWHNRAGTIAPPGTPPPIMQQATLVPLLDVVIGRGYEPIVD
ncbi:MAG: HAD-IA family hydrolase [Vulcanimicrobiaceae bacterium]